MTLNTQVKKVKGTEVLSSSSYNITSELLKKATQEAESKLRREVHLHGLITTKDSKISLEEYTDKGRLLVNLYVKSNCCAGIDVQPPAIHDLLLLDKIKRETARYHELIAEQLGISGEIPEQITKINFPDALYDEITESRVRGWIQGGILLLSVAETNSRNPESKQKALENLLAAKKLANQLGISEVKFDGDFNALTNLKEIGLFKDAPNFYVGDSPRSIKGITEAIASDYLKTEAGNIVFYVPASHERLITVKTIEELFKVASNPDQFLPRIKELINGRKKNSVGTFNFELLVVKEDPNKNGVYQRETSKNNLSTIFQGLIDVYEYSILIDKAEWNEHLPQIQTKLTNFLISYKAKTAPLFHHDDLNNLDWLRIQYCINRGIKESVQMEELPSEFTGRYQIEPCGYIGWLDDNNEAHLGRQPLANCPKDLEQTDFVDYHGKSFYILRHDDPELSTYIFEQDEEGNWYKRAFIFHEGTSLLVKSIQNHFLEHHPSLKYVCIAALPAVRSMTDPNPQLVNKLWYPARSSLLVQLEKNTQEMRQFWLKQSPYSEQFFQYYANKTTRQAAISEKQYNKFVLMQYELLDLFGANCPERELVKFLMNRSDIPHSSVLQNETSMTFKVRKYIAGDSLGRIKFLTEQSVSPDFFKSYALVLGRMAAINLAARRVSFETTDEIAYEFDPYGNPIKACFTSASSAFLKERVITPLINDMTLYAIHLAGLKTKAKIIYNEELALNVTAKFMQALKKQLNEIQKNCKATNFNDYFAAHYPNNTAINPDLNLPEIFKLVVKSLDTCSPDELISRLLQETKNIQYFFDYILSGVKTRREQHELIKEATYLLDSVWLSSLEPVYRTIFADSEFKFLPTEERIRRISSLHTSLSTKMINFDIEALVSILRKFVSKFNDAEAKEYFITKLNHIFKEIYHVNTGLSPALAERFYNSCTSSDDFEARIRQLRTTGYLF